LKNDFVLTRWQRAQAAELDWWANWRQLPFYKNHSFADCWETVLSEFLGNLDAVSPGVIVEVGCGPHGVVRYLFDNAAFKLGIDPLICGFDERPRPGARTGYAAAIGEEIPVRDETADFVLCINVLDHVIDASQILREIRRILKPGGRLLLEVHTFPKFLKPFLLFDPPHTRHWSAREVPEMVKDAGCAILSTQSRRFPIRLTWSAIFNPSRWKYVFGRLFVRLTYVYCQKGAI
jgi:SAM-dependent methyltransferase